MVVRVYAVACYLAFLATLLYVVAWLAGAVVPHGIDDGSSGSAVLSLAVDLLLLSLFAVQHSVMARPWFKRWWTRLVPAAAERATYVLLSSAAVALIAWQWRPLDHRLWHVGTEPWRSLLWVVYGVGWLVVVLSTVMIGHVELFGLTQAWRARHERARAGGPASLRTPGFYAWVRHPIMTGFVIAFWATPDMTVGHLLFAGVSTGYIVVAVRFEEHDLRHDLGPAYEAYAAQVPRFVPVPGRHARLSGSAAQPQNTRSTTARARRVARR